MGPPEKAPPALHVDGPPSVIPHDDFGFACTKCHTHEGKTMRGIGVVTALPHKDPRTLDRCQMCHVYQLAESTFAESGFVPFKAAPAPEPAGKRLEPPVVPHRILLRENCAACHTGKGAGNAPLTDHADRTNCVQCHVPQLTGGELER